ncbi:DUF393 domain-containing protein [Roseovarius spongiae]|uniref:DUF393 domain-containing protein n=1 Tax=Roseovarius spongiae TaxID=2320272 RepID=A0A3A8ARD2_9RHOB|nr:DCC1-like thiol-disulfide oxidoreductase family protein [Roseovarius spongiae]RKF12425.1 DUF393 domain-containing protein [Roseovarius spongiae]
MIVTDTGHSIAAYPDLAALIPQENAILFDGDCIYCNDFARVMSLRSTLGSLALVNVRDAPDLISALRDHGFEPNEGMLFKAGNQLFFGADAVHMLALASQDKGLWGLASKTVFKNPTLVKVAYPLMKLGRRITLIARGKRKIG